MNQIQKYIFRSKRGVINIITLTSTSVLPDWSPSNITNPGPTLAWTVSGGVTIAKTTINDPTFDFSTNTGTANILIENTNDLTIIHADNLDIVTANLSEITSLLSLRFTNNSLISVDISTNTLLQEAFFGNNSLTTFDITSNVNLIIVDCSDNSLATFDLSNNTSLSSVFCNGNSFSSSVTNQILADLVAMGFSGTLHYRNNETGQGVTDRAQLITNGATITNYAT